MDNSQLTIDNSQLGSEAADNRRLYENDNNDDNYHMEGLLTVDC